MNFLSRLLGRRKHTSAIRTEPQAPVCFSGPVEISVQEGLVAHFFRKDKKSWPGVLWAVKCVGAGEQHTFFVRTYFSRNPADEAEKQTLGNKAKEYIATRLKGGPILRDEDHIIE